MSSSKRHFTAVIDSKEYGLYISSIPSSAARKVVSKLCANNKNKKVKFSVREITQGSKKKTYGPYIGYMEKLDKPVELEGRVIKYKPVAKLDKKSSKMIGGNLSDGQNVERLSSLQSIAFTNLTGGAPKPTQNPNNLFSQFMKAARKEKIASEDDIISFAKWYINQQQIVTRQVAENPIQQDIDEMLRYFKEQIAIRNQEHRSAEPARNPFVGGIISRIKRYATEEKKKLVFEHVIAFAEHYASNKPQKSSDFKQKDIEQALRYYIDHEYKDPQETQDPTRAGPARNPDNLFSQFMKAARKEKIASEDDIISFAKWYIKESQRVTREVAENPRQQDIDEMLRYFKEEIRKPNQDPRRAGPARNPDNLFSQFKRVARQEQIAPDDDIFSFAKWYIKESQRVTREVADNPRQQDIDEMLRYFKEVIRKRNQDPRRAEWDLYKQLFDSTTGSLPLDYASRHLVSSMKMISAAFGGNLPTDGNHAILNAYIFRISSRLNFDRIWSFLSATEQKGFPCFLYRSEERFHFDKMGSSNSVSDGQVCCMFLDAVGWRIDKYDPRVVRLDDFQKMSSGKNNEALESGAAISSGAYLEGKVNSGRVAKEMVKLNPALLTKPFPGLNEFMLRQGAFNLMLSIE